MAFKKTHLEFALGNWVDLNIALMRYKGKEGLAFAQELLELEKAGKARTEFLRRIHGRLTKLRTDIERADLMRKRSFSR